jgi:hypothetical protein
MILDTLFTTLITVITYGSLEVARLGVTFI